MMNQTNATRAWEPSQNDLASTDELPQTPDWLLDEVASGAQSSNADITNDTIPSPPPEADGENARATIPAPPPLGDAPTFDD